MKPSLVSKVIATLLPARENVLLTGAPGVGKSDLVAQACTRLGYRVVISHPVVSDPTDYKGFPVYKGGDTADFLPFGDLRELLEATEPLVFFLDDLGQATPAVQAAAMQLLLAREINGKRISEQVRFVAATNRKQDRAGVTGILEPVKSRFATIIEVETDTDDWCRWAIGAGLPIELVAFLRFRPELLHDWHPTADLTNGACPRTWAAAGRLLALPLPEEAKLDVLVGCVGKGHAHELLGFLDVFTSLPSLDGILLNPDSAPVPEDNPAVTYAVVSGLSRKATEGNFTAIVTYANRFQNQDYATVLVKDSLARCPSLTTTRSFTLWCATHPDVFI